MTHLYQLFVICLLFIISNITALCDFQSVWTVSGYKLDLTAFQTIGLNITGSDKDYNYYYSPFNNLQFVKTIRYMVVQQNKSNENDLKHLASMNSDISPTISFNKENNIVWNFKYNSNFSIQFICDPSASKDPPYMNITQIIEVYPYQYLMEIVSYFVCPNNSASYMLGINQCIWNDTTNEYVLNLKGLYGTNIKDLYGSHNYSVCTDSLFKLNIYVSDTYSCAMYGKSTGYDDNVYYWNSSIMPTFNASDNSWTFIYPQSQYNQYKEDLLITWICNTQIDTVKVIKENNYMMIIESKYACGTGSICYFTSKDGKYNLDLTAFSGQMIKAANDDLTYSYEYTPCSNYIKCNDLNVMAMRWDIAERGCDPYLAIFEGNDYDDYTLSYNIDNKQWHFRYFNGEICIFKQHNIFNIYWKCNQQIFNWIVTKVDTINECEYSMYIESVMAC